MKNKALMFLGIILLFTNCSKDNELGPTLKQTLSNNLYFPLNNRIAENRLLQIMYNLTDSIHSYERFKIVHISDPHLSNWSSDNYYQSPNNLIEAIIFSNQKNLKINATVTTGDLIGNMHNTPKKDVINYLNAFIYHYYNKNKIPSFVCLGNHDANMLSTDAKEYISKQELYQTMINKNNYRQEQLSKENYFYADVIAPTGDIVRFISLDMTDQDSFTYDTQHYTIFSQKQINWLCNIALKKNMTTKHHIIILTHYPFQPYSEKGYTYLSDGDFIHTWSMIPEIIEAFRKREILQKTYSNKFISNAPIEVNADFSNSSGDFICYLGGHIHATTQFSIKGFPNESSQLPKQKMLLCTNQSPSETGTYYNKVIRNSNSQESNSFCIYCIDFKERIIYLTFFGAYKPTNKEFYPEIQKVFY